MSTELTTVYKAVRIDHGEMRAVWLEAADEANAREVCVAFGLGFSGKARAPDVSQDQGYDVRRVQEMLGGVSKSFVFSLFRKKKLKRLKLGRRTMVPRESLEEYLSAVKK